MKEEQQEYNTSFDEAEAIRLTQIARPLVDNDPIAMFASDEDKLVYEHFFINGMTHSGTQIIQLKEALESTLEIIKSDKFLWVSDADCQKLEKARKLIE